MSRLGNDDATGDERASVLVSHAGTRPRAAVATPDPAHTRRGARQLDRVRRNAPRPGATRYGAYAVLRVRVYTWCVHMAEDGNRTAYDAGCRAAEHDAPRARRTSILKRGALPARGLKSDRRRRRLSVSPRDRRRDRRRARVRALLPCVDPASRSCRDAELRAYNKRRWTARSRTARRAQSGSDALWRPRGAACTSVHMVRTHGPGWQPSGVRRLLPRGRTQRATRTEHVDPHARRATGARTEERPTTKTTVRHASGTTTRRSMSARACSSPMRGPDLAQLSRRRTPRTQE
jgi:hypothetical protein